MISHNAGAAPNASGPLRSTPCRRCLYHKLYDDVGEGKRLLHCSFSERPVAMMQRAPGY